MKTFGAIMLSFLIGVMYLVLAAWVFMLLIGYIHGEWITKLPTIGYGHAVVVMALTGSIAHVISSNNSRE
jgi:hypothetical protein